MVREHRDRAMGVVLLVEDDEQVRVLAESIIEVTGHEALTAANIQEALALIEGDEPIDLLFTDLTLWGNGQGGIELAQQAVKIRLGLKVLYTTGGGVTDGMRALFVKGSVFLGKPYTADDLICIVSDQLWQVANVSLAERLAGKKQGEKSGIKAAT